MRSLRPRDFINLVHTLELELAFSSRRLWRWLLLFFASLLMVVGLAACQPPPASNTTAEQGGGNSPGNAPQAVVVFGRGGDSPTLDPAVATDGEAFRVTRNILEGLVDLEDGTTNVIPKLAESWQASPDATTYTFKLRQGVKFTDGTDFNADAVTTNFKRWQSGGKNESFSYFNDVFGTDLIQSVTAVDPNTVEFKLSKPFAPFIACLVLPPFAFNSPAAIEKFADKLNENPTGTGPFKLVEWKRNESVTLERNPDYWNPEEPKAQRVIFRAIPENATRLTALKSGEIDLMDDLDPDAVSQVSSDNNLELLKRPSFNVGYIAMNNTKKPFDNPKVRQALAHAVNKQALIDAFYGGNAIPAVNLNAPSLPSYNQDVQDYAYDPDAAKKLLTEAGLPNGFKTDFLAMPVPRPYMPDGRKIAEAIQADLAKIGVQTNIISYEWATYLEKMRTGDYPVGLIGWTGDYGDASNFLNVLLNGANIPGNNYSRYNNAQVNKLLDEAQTTADETKRNDLYKQAQAVIHQDLPVVPLVHSTPLMASRKTVENFKPSPVAGTESMAEVTTSS
ncbi:ABC transporter substrate-binding protein [Leptolyngbya sp. FACHB-261]|uniref:ABC transporter substrate-binding protein n=1 Tax=Leptolyngbya sp. FACHB-261 TaxID=2692806 RepID=UPI00168928AB|nr:ABC transporter substrate-binding protein [Leptolyngbya sp. FACHB-261]MBD2104043.1 ABC transporter substrate-binding protein [Leptolyngbya sp. FACHB-261]